MNYKVRSGVKLGGFMALMITLLWLTVFIGGGIGWILNIVAFASSDFEAPYKNEIIRGIGIPVPILGAVIGWFEIDDTPTGNVSSTTTAVPPINVQELATEQ
jgi:hypothetical protein